jgi:hypothetical protein
MLGGLMNKTFLVGCLASIIIPSNLVSAYDEYEEYSEEPTIEYQGEAHEEDLSYDRSFDDGGDFPQAKPAFHDGFNSESGTVQSPIEPLYEQDSYDSDYDDSYQDY